MKKLPDDVKEKMKIVFRSEYKSALKTIKDYTSTYQYIGHKRIIRCIIFLSDDGSLLTLKKNLDIAKTDTREIMYDAEYELTYKFYRRKVRDFHKSFYQNSIN